MKATTLPGWVNAHTHMYSGLVPFGMPPATPAPRSFVEILERVWWRLDRALDESSLRAAARLYVAESLLAGTTALIDHHESPQLIEGSLDVLADACEELGMRAILTYGATERNGGRDEARRGLAECARFSERRLVRRMVGLHASFTVSDESVRAAARLAEALGCGLHLHVAEDAADVEDARARGYSGVVERLAKLGALRPRSLLAHGVHLGDDEVREAAASGCWFVQNPRSNLNNRVGYPAALAATRRVALGTDGFSSKMDDEASALPPDVDAHVRLDTGRQIVESIFGESLDGDFRTIEAGRVRDVCVDGRQVVRDGELLLGNIEDIREIARREAARLWHRMEAI